MSRRKITATILMAIGVFMLTYAVVTFKTSDSPGEILGGRNETSDFIPPAVGALAFVGGVTLLMVKPQSV